jgi:hypothetical protein
LPVYDVAPARLCTRCRRRRVTLWSRPEPAIGFEPMAKTDVRYWQKRVFFPEYTRDGDEKGTKEWAVRLQHLGRRETFQLGTANKAAATEAIHLKAKSVSFAPTPRDQGNTTIGVGEVTKQLAKVFC